jgi:hypothetical protein
MSLSFSLWGLVIMFCMLRAACSPNEKGGSHLLSRPGGEFV